MYLLIQKTRLGMMIRAGASNREMVQSLGININLLYRLVFALGVALAAFAGMIAAPVASVFPGMGNQVLIVCFVVVVIGGIGSVKGAMLAAILIGLVDTFGKVLTLEIGGVQLLPQLSGMMIYVLMAAVLLARPEGLFGTRLMRQSRLGTAMLLLCLLALLFLPLFAEKYYIQLFTKIMIMAIFAMSLDLLVGFTGLVSLGHAAFFGVAGYVLAFAAPQYQAANLWLSLPLAMACSGLLALVIGALVLRTSGIYFIMVTLAFAQMVYFVFHDTKIAGGADGIYVYVKPVASIAGWEPFTLENHVHFYFVVLLLLVLVYTALRMLLASLVRPGDRRHPRERAAHALARLPHVPLQARVLRARGRAGGHGGLFRRGPVRLRQSGDARLA